VFYAPVEKRVISLPWKRLHVKERLKEAGRRELARYLPDEAKIPEAIREGKSKVEKIVKSVEETLRREKELKLEEIRKTIFKFEGKDIKDQIEELKKEIAIIQEKKPSDITIRDQMLLKRYDFLLNLLKERESEYKKYETQLNEEYKNEYLRRLQEAVKGFAAELCEKYNIVNESSVRTVEAILLAYANESARKELKKWSKGKKVAAAIGHTIETLPGAGEGISGFILGILVTILNPIVVGIVLLTLLFSIAGSFIAGIWSYTTWITLAIVFPLLALVELSRYWKSEIHEEMRRGE